MAFPWVFSSNFEQGTNGHWDSETDTVAQLDIAHYGELARFPWPTATPYSGAYCARWTLSGGTADAILIEGDIDIAADTLRWFKFDLWFSPNFAATADDTVHLFETLATSTIEACFGFKIVAATGLISLGIGEVAPTTFGNPIKRGVWYTVELAIELDDIASNDGTIDIYVHEDGKPSTNTVYAAQVGSLNQAAVTTGSLGIQNHLATTTGVILIDNFIMDDARIYPVGERFPTTINLTELQTHAFIGPGVVSDFQLLSGAGTDCVLTAYDTDIANITTSTVVAEVKNTANNQVVDTDTGPYEFHKGCYVVMSGTTPRGVVRLKQANNHTVGSKRIRGSRR